MLGWIIALFVIITIGGIAAYVLTDKASRSNDRPAQAHPATPARPAVVETGPVVYFANGAAQNADKEYRFNYKKVGNSWRAYILRMPSLGNRPSGVVTHREWDGNRPYVCWDRPVNTLEDMQNISKEWADNIQQYIATGRTFGP